MKWKPDTDNAIEQKEKTGETSFSLAQVNTLLREQSDRYLKIIDSIEESFHQSEMRLRQVIDLVPHPIYASDHDGRFIIANKAFAEQYQLTPDQIMGKNFADLMERDEDIQKELQENRQVIDRGETKFTPEATFSLREGPNRLFQMSKIPFYYQGRIAVLVVAIDITVQKAAETTLRMAHDELEKRVLERTKTLFETNNLLKTKTQNLEAMNTTLRVLLKKREKDQTDIEDKILYNTLDLLLPYLDELKRGKLDEKQKAYIEIIESTLNAIVTPFARNLNSRHFNLTPAELRIAGLIQNGKSTREIAHMSGLSIKTIEFHRENIRSKLGIKKKKLNLRTYLLSLL